MITLSSELLKILVCPVTKQKLIYDRDAQELISLAAGLSFPIVDGIPIMLIDEAKTIHPVRLKRLLDAQAEQKSENVTDAVKSA